MSDWKSENGGSIPPLGNVITFRSLMVEYASWKRMVLVQVQPGRFCWLVGKVPERSNGLDCKSNDFISSWVRIPSFLWLIGVSGRVLKQYHRGLMILRCGCNSRPFYLLFMYLNSLMARILVLEAEDVGSIPT